MNFKTILEKQASAQEPNRDAIAEAFAKQAYSAIENRMALLMNERNMLGFEVIDRNEANTRLVGAAAFRVGNELLIAPLFFLNGTIKGQCLLYLKKEDRFAPNSKDQIRAVLARAEGGDEGTAVNRNATRGATMRLNTRALGAPVGGFKMASAEVRAEILEAWEAAVNCARTYKKASVPPIFKQFLVDNPGMAKKAAELADKDQEFAESIVVARSLQAPVTEKVAASKQPRKLRLIRDVAELPEGSPLTEEFFKRGYAIDESGDGENLLEALSDGRQDSSMRCRPRQGFDLLILQDGASEKVLAGPAMDATNFGTPVGCCEGGSASSPAWVVVGLEGGIKGCSFEVGDDHVFSDQQVFDLEDITELASVGDATPKTGGTYLAYSVSAKSFVSPTSIRVKKVTTDGPVTTVRYALYEGDNGSDLILREDLDAPRMSDGGYGLERFILAKDDTRWIPVDAKEQAGKPQPMRRSQLFDFATSHARGRLKVRKKATFFEAELGPQNRVECPTPATLALKLASAGLSVESANMIVCELVRTGKELEFVLTPPLEKLAHVWFAREPDMDNDFTSPAFDRDFGAEVDTMYGVTQHYPIMRDRQTQPEARYLDAAVPFATGGPDHVPDEVLFAMTNPAQQLSELAQSHAMDTLIDHGALTSLVKTFDAVALAISFLPDLEKGVDRIGRILFLLLWKPADFSDVFGEDDLPQLEMTLTSAFEKHGDLVLDLRQRSSDSSK